MKTVYQLALPGIGEPDIPLQELWRRKGSQTAEIVADSSSLRSLRRRQQYLSSEELAPSTKLNYGLQQLKFIHWAGARGLSHLPAEESTITEFLLELSTMRSYSSVRNYLAAVGHRQRSHGFDDPADMPRVRELVAHLRRHAKRSTTHALTADEIKRILGALGNDPLDLRDKTLIVVSFSAALTSANICDLDRSQIQFLEEGAKLGTFGGRVFFVGRGKHEETCPVRALQRWLAVVGTTPGHLFPAMSARGGFSTEGLISTTICRIIKSAAKKAGVDSRHITTLSFRTGFIQEAARRGVRTSLILHQTGFKRLASLTAHTGTVGEPFELEVELRRQKRARRSRRQDER